MPAGLTTSEWLHTITPMPDVVGYRAKWGVIVPATNTVVEHDFWQVRPPGITFHTGRMYVDSQSLNSDEDFEAFLEQIRVSISDSIKVVMRCKPDYLVMGMSAETFWEGIEGSQEFTQSIQDESGLPVSTGAMAIKQALDTFECKTVAFVSPYQPVGDKQVARFLSESGFEVKRWKGLKCATARDIAAVTENELVEALQDLDGDDIDAIVQVGTNLSMVRLADEAERWLGRPVIAINAAVLWHALRTNGYSDQFVGFGSLLRDH